MREDQIGNITLVGDDGFGTFTSRLCRCILLCGVRLHMSCLIQIARFSLFGNNINFVVVSTPDLNCQQV